MKKIHLITIAFVAFVLVCYSSFVEGFDGLESTTLSPVEDSLGEWGLKIVVLDVGQADAILVMTPNGDVCLIDSGKYKSDGNKIADFLSSKTLNGIGNIKVIDILYTTHYDLDHIGGLPQLVERGIRVRKAFDQGLSKKRHGKSKYAQYVKAVGDINDNMVQDDNEPNFVRHKIHYGNTEYLGLEDQVEIQCVSVRGDTKGTNHDIDLDPTNVNIDENPGSIALLIKLGEFEFYTAGDQSDNDWKQEPAVEEMVLNSGAIADGNDIDVIKVNHHGSDTSTSSNLVRQMDPEVAIVSSKRTDDHIPKKIVLKQFQDNDCYVLITGDVVDPDTQDYYDAITPLDNGFVALESAVFNNQGNVTVLVSGDGSKYTIISDSFARTFSAVDAQNVHQQ